MWKALTNQPDMLDKEQRIAKPGTIWVCAACGKTAQDPFDGPRGWDESCMLKAVLCYASGNATYPQDASAGSMQQGMGES